MLEAFQTVIRLIAHYMLNKIVAVHYFCRKCPQDRFCDIEFFNIERVLKQLVERPVSDLLKHDLDLKEWENENLNSQSEKKSDSQ